jgi:hypothetical protein
VAFKGGVGFKNAVRSGVVGIFVDGVGADLLAGGGEAEIDDSYVGDGDGVQVGSRQVQFGGASSRFGMVTMLPFGETRVNDVVTE